MGALDRLNVIWRSANIKVLLYMALGYGVFYGGIFQIGTIASGDVSILDFLLGILFSAMGFECMFLFIILIIVISINIKCYISLGMDRLTVTKLWRDLLGYVTLVIVAFIYIILIMGLQLNKGGLLPRVLNININAINFLEYLVIACFLAVLILFFNISVSIITVIGSRFGMMYCFSFVFVWLGLIVFALPQIIALFMWGQNLIIICGVLTLLDIGLYLLTQKLLIKIEVAR